MDGIRFYNDSDSLSSPVNSYKQSFFTRSTAPSGNLCCCYNLLQPVTLEKGFLFLFLIVFQRRQNLFKLIILQQGRNYGKKNLVNRMG